MTKKEKLQIWKEDIFSATMIVNTNVKADKEMGWRYWIRLYWKIEKKCEWLKNLNAQEGLPAGSQKKDFFFFKALFFVLVHFEPSLHS